MPSWPSGETRRRSAIRARSCPRPPMRRPGIVVEQRALASAALRPALAARRPWLRRAPPAARPAPPRAPGRCAALAGVEALGGQEQRRAARSPIARITKGEITAGMSPSRTSAERELRAFAAIAMSQAATSPTPAADGRTLHHARSPASGTRRPCSIICERPRVARFRSSRSRRLRFIQFRSAPAEKLLPRAGKHDRAHGGILAQRPRTPSVSSGISASSKALCSSRAVRASDPGDGPSRVDRQTSVRHAASHPEHAEARRPIGALRPPRAPGPARGGVGRVDHAVVPQPGGGVVGMALASRTARGSAP